VKAKGKKTLDLLAKRAAETRRVEQLFEHSDYTLISMRECDFKQQLMHDTELREFIRSRQPRFFQKTGTRSVSQRELLSAIQRGAVFGLARVKASVPSEWTGIFQHERLSPREFFDIFCPIFENKKVPYSCLGSYMCSHIRSRQLGEKCEAVLRRALAGSRATGRPINRHLLSEEIARIRRVCVHLAERFPSSSSSSSSSSYNTCD
jgi:hypothetical protein